MFVAFPADVADEVESLDGVLDEINRSAGDALDFRLELVRWDRNASPGVDTDPQQVVNRQIEGDFDILVGIFWTRAGTPTPRATSGSIEEVLRAVEQSKSKNASVQVLTYFKREKIDPYVIDLEQFARLREFQRNLSLQGVLFKNFDDVTSLESFLRVDLVRVSKELVRRNVSSGDVHEGTLTIREQTSRDDDDDLGLLDFIDINESSLAKAGELMAGITSALQTMTQSDLRRGEEIRKLGGSERAEARRILQRTAEDWDATASNIETMLAALKANTNEAFKALSRSIPLMATGSKEAIEKRSSLRETLVGVSINMGKAAASTQGVRDTFASYPRLIAEHNRAKRRLVSVLDDVSSHFLSVVDMANDIAASLGKL